MDYKDAKKVLELCERATLGHDGDDGDAWFDDYLTEVDAELIAIAHTALPYWVNRACQLEAEAAAMREALGEARDLYGYAYYEGVYAHMGYKERKQKWYGEAKKILINMKQVLSPDAGKALLKRVQRLEAESAVIRAALEELITDLPHRDWWCPTCKRTVDGKEVTFEDYHETCGTYLGEVNSPGWLTKVQAALSCSAGKDLLERVQKLEEVARIIKQWEQFDWNVGLAIEDDGADNQSKLAYMEFMNKLRKALNALEGGTE